MGRFAQGFAAAYLLAAVYFGTLFWVTGAVRPRGAELALALVWPVTMAGMFSRIQDWPRNRDMQRGPA